VHMPFDVNDPSKCNFAGQLTFRFFLHMETLLPKTLTPIDTVVHYASCTLNFYAAGIVHSGTNEKPYITTTDKLYVISLYLIR